jgi:hypothetical protein
VAQTLSMNPHTRSTSFDLPRSQLHLVREAVEPSGDGLFVEAMREWIERVGAASRPASLRLVR